MAKLRAQASLKLRFGPRPLQTPNVRRDLTVVDDKLQKSTGMMELQIANDSVEVEVDVSALGVTDGRLVYIESNKELTVKLNATGNTAFYLTPPTDEPSGAIVDDSVRESGFLFLKTKNVTKVLFTNASDGVADVQLFVVGNPT